MKKLIILISISISIILIASTSIAADWPPAKPGLLKSLSCVKETYCAVFTLRGGATEVSCKSGDKITASICKLSSTVTQKCDNGSIVNVYDSPAVKCQKVCLPEMCVWK